MSDRLDQFDIDYIVMEAKVRGVKPSVRGEIVEDSRLVNFFLEDCILLECHLVDCSEHTVILKSCIVSNNVATNSVMFNCTFLRSRIDVGCVQIP